MRSLSRSLFRPKNGVDQTALLENKPLVEKIERRLFLRQGLSLGALTLLTGCDISNKSSVQAVLKGFSRWNDRAQAWLFDPQKLAPTFSEAEVAKQAWLKQCAAKKKEWRDFRYARFAAGPLGDAVWQRPVLGQPAAIKVVADFAKRIGAVKYFDAGDVQANGFQVIEDDRSGDTFTETGASYMGFAASALLGTAASPRPRYGIAFTGDGSFMMNPQILIDAVEHGVQGMIVIFDNRRMAAITNLQIAQYGKEFRTNDSVSVDYARLASAVTGVKALHGGWSESELNAALEQGHAHTGLSVLHVPVYAGENLMGGLSAWGEWNVGNWCDDVQDEWLAQEI